MDHTYVDAKNIKSLEDLICNLVSEIATLLTLKATQERALEIGIMKEDQMQRAGNIVGMLDALILFYIQQADSVEELLPPEFSVEAIGEKLKAAHIKKARALTRKPKVKE